MDNVTITSQQDRLGQFLGIGINDVQPQVLNKFITKAPPERVYHYTSSEGMCGIAKAKRLWASKHSFLNDSNGICQ